MLERSERTVIADDEIELSIVMPCLNEAETVGNCVEHASRFLEGAGICGEIVVADNGSVDGSQAVAAAKGARVVAVNTRGYGAALLGGIAAARGRFVIMGDADDSSYDFGNLMPFVELLRTGSDLVMGNRFQGGIDDGAMPFLHRYIGNPVLTFIGRLFFKVAASDFHCGLRGFHRERTLALNLRTTGMEFASEMVVRSALAGYTIAEVPTILRRDGRSRRSHLRPWSDGWKHLRFLLMYSPKWLFLYPGFILVSFGVIGTALLLPGPVMVGSVGFDIHTFIVSCICILLGMQSISFGFVARRYGMRTGFIPASSRYVWLFDALTLERLLVFALMLCLVGLVGLAWCISSWVSVGFGPLQYAGMVRMLMLSLTAIAAAIQLALTAFVAGIMEIPTQR